MKEKLVQRIIQFENENRGDNAQKREMEEFLNLKKRMPLPQMPPIPQLYYDTFNGVDCFNQFLGYFPYQHKTIKKEMIIFINLIKMIAMNTRTICQELGAQEMIENNEENFKKFIAALAEDLMKQ